MHNRLLGLVMTLATVLAVLSLGAIPAAGQAPAPTVHEYAPPRTPDGQPDIQGVWHGVPGGSYSIQDLYIQGVYQGGRPDERLRGKSRIVDPADGKIPYQPWAAAKAKDIFDKHLDPKSPYTDPVSRCIVQSVPRGMFQNYFEILQLPGTIVIFIEHVHAYRVIPLDGRPHLSENVKLFMGNSRARWEGNTLVIDSTNFNKLTWFDIVGSFHSEALHIVERLTPLDANTINYVATIEDPKVYARPWKLGVRIERERTNQYELWEEACHEGERSGRRRASLLAK